VFPGLTAAEIPSASVETVAEWDSLAAVTLMAVVEEEFAVRIDELDLPELDSFEAFQDYLHAREAT
jgi:acyl carrier protein